MTINKLPSGSYRIREQYLGKRYSITIDHKPTVFEAEELMRKKIHGYSETPVEGTVLELTDRYIMQCRVDNKSPTTVTNYQSIVRNTPYWFVISFAKTITPELYQKMINEYARNHSPKSVKNLCGFYRCVFVFCDLRHLKDVGIQLPRKNKNFEYEPTTEDVRAILEYIKGSPYEIIINLCAIGLRRGEALAITKKDLDKNNVLTINKDLIKDGNRYVIKNHPKTDASNRRIRIPDNVADLIRNSDKVYDMSPNSIGRYLHKVQDILEIPRFRLHMLRHFSAAYLLKNKFSSTEIEDYMGWEHGSETMKKVYAYVLDPHESQKEICDIFSQNWK